jgi:hypothetical protein
MKNFRGLLLLFVCLILVVYVFISYAKDRGIDKLVYSENGVKLYHNQKSCEYTIYEDGSELLAPERQAEEKITCVEIYDHIDLLTCSYKTWVYYRVYLREEKKWLLAKEGGSTFKRFKLYKDKIILERVGEGLTVYTFDTKVVEEVFPY